MLLGCLALSNRSMQVLRWQEGQWVVVGNAQRSCRVVAGSRLETECRVQQQYSTGWCLVESPDDESPSGPRNEEGHGRFAWLSRFFGALRCGGRSGGCAALTLRKRPRENLGSLRLVKTSLRVRRTLHAET